MDYLVGSKIDQLSVGLYVQIILGYAVTAGRYFSKSGKMFSIAGAPAANQTGLVSTQCLQMCI